MSILPDCSASNRAAASSDVNVTLPGSPSAAAATARQISTSSPLHSPLSSWLEKPSSPWPTPQLSVPRSLTAFSVCAAAGGLPAASRASSIATEGTKRRQEKRQEKRHEKRQEQSGIPVLAFD